MAIGLLKKNSIIGLAEESTEGIFVAPPDALSFIQPLEEGFELAPAREDIERAILKAGIGEARSRVGMKSVTAALPMEYRASGIEGGKPDFDLLLKSALGDSRQITTRNTTKAGNGVSQLEIEDADIGDYKVGDSIVILEAADFSVHVITAVDPSGGSANVTYLPVRTGAPADNVEISKATTYFPASVDHIPLSLSYYWGNKIRESGIGCKVNSLSISTFSTGQVASYDFGLEGLNYDEIVDVAPFTPVYDIGTPPVLLNACVFQDGIALPLNEFAFTLENTLSFLTDVCDPNGRIKSRVENRVITGTINPYKEDDDTLQHDKFDLNTPYSLFVQAFNPDASGKPVLGSVLTLFLPNVTSKERTVGDLDGTLIENISYKADRGNDGTTDEVFIGMI